MSLSRFLTADWPGSFKPSEDPDELLIDDLPYIRAEVVHACRSEMALTPSDVLARRTSITLEDYQRGQGVVEAVAALMAKELGWSAEQQQTMIAEFRAAVGEELAAETALEITSRTP